MANPFKKGHKRVGGRKIGSPWRKNGVPSAPTKAVVERVKEEIQDKLQIPMHDMTPLEAMLLCMHWSYVEQDRQGILAAAAAAAPYLHQRLNTTELHVTPNWAHLSDKELNEKIREIEARIAESSEDDSIEVEALPGDEPDDDDPKSKLN